MAGREIAMAKRAILCLIAGFISVGFSSSTYSLYFGLLPFGTDKILYLNEASLNLNKNFSNRLFYGEKFA